MTLQAEQIILKMWMRNRIIFLFFIYMSCFILLALNHISCVFVFKYVQNAAVVVFAETVCLWEGWLKHDG